MDDITALLRDSTSDLRANNRDLRLILAFMEKESARLQKDMESENAANRSLRSQVRALIHENEHLQERVEELEELLELRVGTVGSASSPGDIEVLASPVAASQHQAGDETRASNSLSPTRFGEDRLKWYQSHRSKRSRHDSAGPVRRSTRVARAPKRRSSANGLHQSYEYALLSVVRILVGVLIPHIESERTLLHPVRVPISRTQHETTTRDQTTRLCNPGKVQLSAVYLPFTIMENTGTPNHGLSLVLDSRNRTQLVWTTATPLKLILAAETARDSGSVMRQSKRTPVRCPIQFRVSSAMEIPTVPNTPSNRDRKSSTRAGRRLRRASAIVLSLQPSLRSLTLNDGANRTTGHENLLNGDGSREMKEDDAMILDNGPSQGAQAHGGEGGQTVRYGKPIVASATVTTHSPMRGSFPLDIDVPSHSATPVGASFDPEFFHNLRITSFDPHTQGSPDIDLLFRLGRVFGPGLTRTQFRQIMRRCGLCQNLCFRERRHSHRCGGTVLLTQSDGFDLVDALLTREEHAGLSFFDLSRLLSRWVVSIHDCPMSV
ncbi:hypothetical protein FA13DRAFT_1708413 [Coprinellus micaceus]|uniref:Uncharacterized protein n=1 Tax=Coprinellus micaceus TaxID=71717 RepID=A0A4Y7TFP2_COPMI|nr:hypothetical protein FA13DRAFT_1708413 [Coprinellus micaceus]